MLNAQIHRFRDKVALHVGDGQTVYLTPAEAGALARGLMVTLNDCQQIPKFSQSQCGTFNMEFKGDK